VFWPGEVDARKAGGGKKRKGAKVGPAHEAGIRGDREVTATGGREKPGYKIRGFVVDLFRLLRRYERC
jgi:hypothetical protein